MGIFCDEEEAPFERTVLRVKTHVEISFLFNRVEWLAIRFGKKGDQTDKR